MYTATNMATQERHQFRSLRNLVRRLGGDHFQVEHETANKPPNRFVMVLRWVPRANSYEVVCRVKIDSDEFDRACDAMRETEV